MLEKLKRKANKLYKEMTRALKDTEDAHRRFHKYSGKYAETLKEIEAEVQNPKEDDKK